MTDQHAISVVSQSLMPAMEAQQARARYEQLQEFIKSQMREGIDFGSIPGMEDRKDPKTGEVLPAKKVLLKPGAEKLSTLFALRPQFADVQSIEDWTGKDHNGEIFFYYRVKCTLWRNNELICDADGSCNSMEKKYRYRQASRICPKCDQATIIKGKEDYGGGWLCWIKKGGCGAKFADGDITIERQDVGQIPNPDIAEQTNTILKMAQKRALIAAILIAANASDYFTQDIEEDETKVEEKPKVVDAKGEPEKSSPNTAPVRPYDPETVKNGIANYADKHAKTGEKASEKFRGLICGMIELCFERDDADTKTKKRHSVLKYLTGQDSIKDVPDWYVHALSDWLKFTQDSGGIYIVDKFAVQEANKIVEKVLLDAGQLKL
jgi:hypothetical protein